MKGQVLQQQAEVGNYLKERTDGYETEAERERERQDRKEKERRLVEVMPTLVPVP